MIAVNTELRGLMSDLLMESGWDVLLCSQGNEALEILKLRQPDAIVLDSWLETRDGGWEVLRQLLLDPALWQIPVILSSGDIIRLREYSPWLAAHGVPVLVQPFNIDDLYAIVNSALTEGASMRGRSTG